MSEGEITNISSHEIDTSSSAQVESSVVYEDLWAESESADGCESEKSDKGENQSLMLINDPSLVAVDLNLTEFDQFIQTLPDPTSTTSSTNFETLRELKSQFEKYKTDIENRIVICNKEISKRMGSDAAKKVRHQRCLVKELLQTENTYLGLLSKLVDEDPDSYEQRFRALGENNESLLHKFDAIFSPVREIALVNKKFCVELEKYVENWETDEKLGDLFIRWAPLFFVYSKFAANKEENSKVLSNFMNDSKLHLQFDAKMQLDVNSCYSKPIQRLPQYLLFMKDMINHTDANHHDYPSLQRALFELSKVTREMNAAVAEKENLQITKWIESNKSLKHILYQDNGKKRKLLCYLEYTKLWDVTNAKSSSPATQLDGGYLFFFKDYLVASTFSESKMDVPLIWIDTLITTETLAKYGISADGLQKLSLMEISAPEAKWLVLVASGKEGIRDWIEFISTTLNVDPSNEKELSRGAREGAYTWPDVGYYVGKWRARKPHGYGHYIRNDGATFTGLWDFALFSGFGVVAQGDNDPYKCGWLNSIHEGGNVQTIQEVQTLKDKVFFWQNQKLEETDWSLLTSTADIVTYEKDQPIYKEGSCVSCLYRVKTGSVRLEKRSVKYGPGDIFGVESLHSTNSIDFRMPTTAVADSNCEVYVMDWRAILGIIDSSPIFNYKFSYHISSLLHELHKKLIFKFSFMHNQNNITQLSHFINKSQPLIKDSLANMKSSHLSSSLPSFNSSSLPLPTPFTQLSSSTSSSNVLQSASSSSQASSSGSTTLPTDAQLEVINANSKYAKRFSLPVEEKPLREAPVVFLHKNGSKPGMLFISSGHVCFAAEKKLNKTYKIVLQISKISKLEGKHTTLTLHIKKKEGEEYQFEFTAKNSCSEFYSLLLSLTTVLKKKSMKPYERTNSAGVKKPQEIVKLPNKKLSGHSAPAPTSAFTMNVNDWMLLHREAKLETFSKGMKMLDDNQKCTHFYHVVEGSCDLVMGKGDRSIGVVKKGEIFGENAMIGHELSFYKVVALDDCKVYSIPVDYINLIFVWNTNFPAKFYSFLASMLAKRLNRYCKTKKSTDSNNTTNSDRNSENIPKPSEIKQELMMIKSENRIQHRQSLNLSSSSSLISSSSTSSTSSTTTASTSSTTSAPSENAEPKFTKHVRAKSLTEHSVTSYNVLREAVINPQLKKQELLRQQQQQQQN
eukprot:TRINITY_DN4421_c0_g1_i1.p1 TRINITY_DN4421_c0_g1~~TRINITY_DN4421_c0_g1_i1.p1  ORF type:complete len:1190 (+),score=330.80 TRINITY_DN4421_c0_g1_i1:36-3605(+)